MTFSLKLPKSTQLSKHHVQNEPSKFFSNFQCYSVHELVKFDWWRSFYFCGYQGCIFRPHYRSYNLQLRQVRQDVPIKSMSPSNSHYDFLVTKAISFRTWETLTKIGFIFMAICSCTERKELAFQDFETDKSFLLIITRSFVFSCLVWRLLIGVGDEILFNT